MFLKMAPGHHHHHHHVCVDNTKRGGRRKERKKERRDRGEVYRKIRHDIPSHLTRYIYKCIVSLSSRVWQRTVSSSLFSFFLFSLSLFVSSRNGVQTGKQSPNLLAEGQRPSDGKRAPGRDESMEKHHVRGRAPSGWSLCLTLSLSHSLTHSLTHSKKRSRKTGSDGTEHGCRFLPNFDDRSENGKQKYISPSGQEERKKKKKTRTKNGHDKQHGQVYGK
ncbi:uncharacterized protein K489DRAFT_89561 [Dissoconium aciculare CBS 342.82]|uniref:Uncharacterized protein n=1 Tax=Dissoconium aciculare CBS 342.82 TaxID=1314786 RepID=A0A6J3LSY6_9PEZI|nr:uncharacterized protein K489DRAFT_89561 [Dissoconium aciculare CBS 342.82]KAF1818748.1 hypothetical protein K489DRAFT_89561 [Dissoconium aciculare CBS 342.82]